MRWSRRGPKGREWTVAEYKAFLELKASGMQRADIAKKLRRSYFSIKSKITELNRGKTNTPKRFYEIPTVMIMPVEVPEWYELGWRFVGFNGALCVFQWWRGEPRYPISTEERIAA